MVSHFHDLQPQYISVQRIDLDSWRRRWPIYTHVFCCRLLLLDGSHTRFF